MPCEAAATVSARRRRGASDRAGRCVGLTFPHHDGTASLGCARNSASVSAGARFSGARARCHGSFRAATPWVAVDARFERRGMDGRARQGRRRGGAARARHAGLGRRDVPPARSPDEPASCKDRRGLFGLRPERNFLSNETRQFHRVTRTAAVCTVRLARRAWRVLRDRPSLPAERPTLRSSDARGEVARP